MGLTPNQRDDMVGALRRAQTAVGNYGAARPWHEPIHLIVRVVEDLVNIAFEDTPEGPSLPSSERLRALRTAVTLVSEHGENPEYDRALVEFLYDLTGTETTADRLREIQKGTDPRGVERRRAHVHKHTEVPEESVVEKARHVDRVLHGTADEVPEGMRSCDECGRTTDAGEAPDWVNGVCENCDPSILGHHGLGEQPVMLADHLATTHEVEDADQLSWSRLERIHTSLHEAEGTDPHGPRG